MDLLAVLGLRALLAIKENVVILVQKERLANRALQDPQDVQDKKVPAEMMVRQEQMVKRADRVL